MLLRRNSIFFICKFTSENKNDRLSFIKFTTNSLRMRLTLFLLILLISPFRFVHAQNMESPADNKNLVQFSGITITADSLNPVPFAKIVDVTRHKGTTTDANGYFSFVAHKRDTITFTALGFKPASFIIPDTITKQHYSLIQVLSADTLTLAAAFIFPWPTLEDFKRAFVETRIPDDDLEIARKNLQAADIRMAAEEYPMDASMNYRNYMDSQTSKLYYFGQQQPFNIFNPFAWAQFIKAWKDGKFKSQEERLK